MMVNIVWRLYHHLVGRVRRLVLVMVVLRSLLLYKYLIIFCLYLFLVGFKKKEGSRKIVFPVSIHSAKTRRHETILYPIERALKPVILTILVVCMNINIMKDIGLPLGGIVK